MPLCQYCSIKEGIYPIEDWSKPGVFHLYCADHIKGVELYYKKEADQFYKLYKDDVARSWLNQKQLQLWQRIDKEKKTKQKGR